MRSETFAFLAASVIVAGSCALLFVVYSRRAFSSRYMSLWLTASLLVVLCTISYLAEAQLEHPPLVAALGNGAMLGAAGFVWLGCRSFNRLSIRLGWVVAAVLAVMILTVLPSSVDPTRQGMFPKLIGLTAFSALTAFESRRGVLGSFRVSWVMTIAQLLYALYAGSRAMALSLQGHDGSLFVNYFNVEIMTTVSLAFVLVNTIVLVLIRIEELVVRRGHGVRGCYMSLRKLVALHRQRAGSAVLSIEILDFGVIRQAYGSAHAQELVTRLFDCALRSIPNALAIASDRDGTVSVLLPHPPADHDVITAVKSEYRTQSSGLADGYASTLKTTMSVAANVQAKQRENGGMPRAVD